MWKQLAQALEAKTTLYFSRNAAPCGARGKKLVLRSGEDEVEFLFCHIRRVVLIGRANIGTPVIYSLMRAQIDIDWLDVLGRPIGQIMPMDDDVDMLAEAQAAFAASPQALALARQLLLAKFDNCHESIRRKTEMKPPWNLERKPLLEAQNAESLRGAEGMAAREYFSLWKDIMHGFEWRGRHPRPAPDPVNMMLSLGYSLLHNRLASALRHCGLNPRQGFFHMGRGRHCALASDLMEPFRALVDAAVLSLIRFGRVRPGDFRIKSGQCACAGNSVFSRLLLAFEEMFSTSHVFYISPHDNGQKNERSLNDALDDLAESFALHISQGEDCIIPRLAPCPAT